MSQACFSGSSFRQGICAQALLASLCAILGSLASLPTHADAGLDNPLNYTRLAQAVNDNPAGQLRQDCARQTIPETIAPLKQLLQAQDWAAADRETRRLIAPEFVSLRPPANWVVTSPLIQAIDQAWLQASNGRFGLSVQARIWQAVKAAYPQNEEAAVNAFRDRVGWKLTTPRSEPDFISSDWLNESELTYSLNAPVGHLPWAGVSDAVVRAIAIPPAGEHCGSCTTDAMQLRNEHFYRYLPQLFVKVQGALASTKSQP